jgi:hypothetical protein
VTANVEVATVLGSIPVKQKFLEFITFFTGKSELFNLFIYKCANVETNKFIKPMILDNLVALKELLRYF